MTSSDIEFLQRSLETLLKKLRYSILGVVDGFDHPGNYLLHDPL